MRFRTHLPTHCLVRTQAGNEYAADPARQQVLAYLAALSKGAACFDSRHYVVANWWGRDNCIYTASR